MKAKRKKVLLIIVSIVFTIVLICVAGYFYLVNRLKASLTGCTVQTEQFMETIDFEYADNWIVVKVKVEGSDKEYPFFFDTGATTIISDSLLRDLNKSNYKLFSSNNRKDTSNAFHNKLYILNGLSIGKVHFKDVGAMSFDNERWEMLNCVSPYGIIGCNVLESCCFQIDYINKKITITDQIEQLPNYNEIEWLNYRTDKQETPIVAAVLNHDIQIDLFIDTGSSGDISLYSPALYNQFSGLDPERVIKMTLFPTIFIRGESPTPYKSLSYKASDLIFLGNKSPEDFTIAINNTPEKNFTGIAGNRFLKHYNLTLDYNNKRIGYVFNKQVSAVEEDSFGFKYFTRNGKLYISAIYENSPIEKMGICVGDEIISINDIIISELPQSAFCEIYRKEYNFRAKDDTFMDMIVKRDTATKQLRLQKFKLFSRNNSK